ncbi:MAG: HAD family hydrolase [Ruminococcaceae bacterium]|nr:HAD family hydrolase [Oscillospiraceae bacterium]
MKYFDTYLFDFDGTLVDSMPSYCAAMKRILDDFGIPYGPDLIKIITPLGTIGTAKYYVEKMGVPASEEQLILRMKEYLMDAYWYRIPAKKNVEETLKALKAKGASLNVLTASPHVTLDACLKRLGLFELFDNVWSCDDFFTTKADPEIYKMAAEKMGTTVDRVLFLDDNYNADKTAKSANMPVCGVYDESSEEYTEQIRALCDFYIDDFSQLLDF